MSYDNIQMTRGPIASIIMSRPEIRNALSLAMMGEMIEALRDLGGDPETRAIIIGGSGPAFSAGHDLKEVVGGDAAAYRRVFERSVELMTAIQQAPQPVIAQVNAMATASGCQLVAACGRPPPGDAEPGDADEPWGRFESIP